MASGWIPFFATALGGLLAIAAGVLGQVYAARAQTRLHFRQAEDEACADLIAVFVRLQTEYALLSRSGDWDDRLLSRDEKKDEEVDQEMRRLVVRISDKELRTVVTDFAELRWKLEDDLFYPEFLALLRERCGSILRGEVQRSSLTLLTSAMNRCTEENRRDNERLSRRSRVDQPGLSERQHEQADADEHHDP